MQSVKLRRHRSQIGSLQSFRRQHWGDQILVLTLHFVFVFICSWISFHILLNLFFLFSSLYFPMLSEREPLERCQMEVDSWNVTLGRWYQPHTTFSHWTLHNSYWRGIITFEEALLLSLLLLERYTRYLVAHFSTLHSINLSLTIILKAHTITSFTLNSS